MSDIKIPLVGEVPKKWAVIGSGTLAVILGIAYWRHRNAANSTASTSAATGTTDPIDPSTGIPYSQEVNGGISPYDYGGGSYFGTGDITGYTPSGQPVYSTGVTGSISGYTTNSDWTTAAVSVLNAAGISVTDAENAIQRVLAGLSVTTLQQEYFMRAVGQLGEPPQGYPKPIKLTDTPGQPGGSGSVTAPKSAPSNFSVTPHPGAANFGWHAVTGANQYNLVVTGTGGTGTGAGHSDTTIAGLNAHISLPPGHYTAHVRAGNTGKWGPWSPAHVFTVPK